MIKPPKTYYIKTFGCQANEADSERIAGWYQLHGFKPARKIEEADEIVINTCSVRQTAEDRVVGLINNIIKRSVLGQLGQGRTLTKRQKIILAGCMLRYPIADLKRRFPTVDEFLRMEEVGFDLEPVRLDKKDALVPIMEGCNKFCSYCVVPYARGREKSRSFEEVVCEVKKLVDQGYKEITLIGQNVNSFGKNFSPAEIGKIKTIYLISDDKQSPFAILLLILNKIKRLKKIKFITSNPWDLTDDIIQSIKLPKVEKYLHLPVQSGDDRVLKKMNRPYTALQYLSLINKIRKKVPGIKIGTDIIVGFPGETKKAFANTVKLCQKANFSKAYIAKYSPRPGTAAFRLGNNISQVEKKRRWRILDELINKKSPDQL